MYCLCDSPEASGRPLGQTRCWSNWSFGLILQCSSFILMIRKLGRCQIRHHGQLSVSQQLSSTNSKRAVLSPSVCNDGQKVHPDLPEDLRLDWARCPKAPYSEVSGSLPGLDVVLELLSYPTSVFSGFNGGMPDFYYVGCKSAHVQTGLPV